MSMNRLHKIVLGCMRASRRDSPTIANNRLFIDGRMCVVPERALPVSIPHRSLLAFGSTSILLCEAWGGAA